jgi:hypothetical protein
MQIPHSDHHRPLHASNRWIRQNLQIMLPIDGPPGIEDVVAETGKYLEEIMERIDILMLHLVFLHPFSLLFRLGVLEVELEH